MKGTTNLGVLDIMERCKLFEIDNAILDELGVGQIVKLCNNTSMEVVSVEIFLNTNGSIWSVFNYNDGYHIGQYGQIYLWYELARELDVD